MSQLESTCILLAEYIMVEQPLNTVEELHSLQSGLHFCLRSNTEHTNDTSSIVSEMARRSNIFGFCSSVNRSLLLGFPTVPIAIGNHLRLPCSQKRWEQLYNEESVQDVASRYPPGDPIVPSFDAFSRQTDSEEACLHIDATPQTMLVMTALAVQRMQVAKEASQLLSLTNLVDSEYAKFM